MVSVFVTEQKSIKPDFVGGGRSKGETAEFPFAAKTFRKVTEVGVDTDNLSVGELENKAGAAEPIDDYFTCVRGVISDVFNIINSRLLVIKKTD